MAFNVKIEYVCQRKTAGLEPLIITGYTGEINSIYGAGIRSFFYDNENPITIPETYGPGSSAQKLNKVYYRGTYYKKENDLYLSELNYSEFVYNGIDDNFDGNVDDLTIKVYYSETSEDNFGPSADELGPTTPEIPYAPWSTKIEYYIDNVKTTFFQDMWGVVNYPTSISNIKTLKVENYGNNSGEPTGVTIDYLLDGADTHNDYEIKSPSYTDSEGNVIYYLNYSGIGGAVLNTEHNYLNNFSTLKIYFTKNKDLTYRVNVAPKPLNGGTVSKVPSSTTYNYSDKVTISATPKTDGYKFNKWSINNLGNGTTTDVNTSSHTFYVINNYNCTAYFTPDTYNIIYKDKGNTTFSGNNSSSLPKTHTYGTTTTLVNGSKTGYKFEGWYTDSACESTALTSISNTYYTEDKSITLYAKWTPKEYTITYTNLKGATNPTSNPSKYTIETPTITFSAPTKNLPRGYTWSKWNPSSITKGSTGNKTITAQWTTNKYTLTWNANGGTIPSSPAYTSGSVSYGTTITKPSNPTKTGNTFNGWKDQDGSTTIETTMPAKNLTYTAQWTVNSYIINLNGGSSSQTSVKINYGSSTFINTSTGAVTTIITPTKEGHTFKGWYTASGGNGSLIINTAGNLQANVSGYTNSSGQWIKAQDTTVYAYYTVNPYNITYKDKGNTTFSGNNSSSLPKTHRYGTATTLVNGSKTGYKFEGWYKDSACGGTAIKTLGATDYTNDITLFAKWTPIEYTITYYINGGTGTLEPTTYTVEDETFSLPEPTKSGYTFNGWYSNGSFSGTATSEITKGSTGNRTYYAMWLGDECTITVIANPSELTSRLTGGGNYKIGDSITITAPSEYDVYKFKNWTKNNSVVSPSTTYNFTANGNATYVANFIDNRKSALFKIHILDDSYNETGLCNVEIKYGNLDNPSENSIKRTDDRTIEIEGTTSICSVTKTHISGTNFSDKVNGTLLSQVFYAFPESINNKPFINILYNGNVIENEYSYTNNSLEFDVYYGKLPKNESGGGSGEPGSSDNSEITVRFKYYLDGDEIDTSKGEYINWPTSNIDELKCYWFKYNGKTQYDEEIGKTGANDRINFTYTSEYYGDPDVSDPPSNLKDTLEIQAPMYTGLTDPILKIEDVICTNTEEIYNYKDCTDNILDVSIYFKSYKFYAYVYSNLPDYGEAYIGYKGNTQTAFHASDIAPMAISFNADVLNDAYEFNRWVNYNDKDEVALSTANPWVINPPKAHDYHIKAIFTGRQLNIALDPNDGTAHAWWQHVGIVAGTKRFKAVSFNLDEDIRKPSDRTGYEFLGWYTSETNNNGSGDLIIDKNGNLQANVPGWTTSDGLWIKGPTVDTSECTHNVIVYAKWKPIEYTITYKDQYDKTFSGKHASGYPTKHTYGSTTTLKDPTKTENTFGGWFTNSSCTGNPITSIGPEDYTKNITLYAKWIVNKYTLTWDLKGGTVTTAGTCAPLKSTGSPSGQVEYLSSITAPIVSKNGYTFLGWSANGVDVITPTTTMPNGNVKYIAVYSTKTYKISVNAIPDELKDKVYILKGDDKNNKYTTTTCTTNDKITLIAENTDEYLLSYWQKSGGNVVSGQNEFTFTANDTYLDDTIDNNIFTAYYDQDPRATLKINFIVDDFIEKTAIFKFNETFSFLGDITTDGYRCEIQGEAECIDGNISINQGYFFIPSKYNGEDICVVPNEQGSGTSKLICSNKGITIGRDGNNSQYYEDNTVKNKYCPTEFEWQAYLPTNIADETHLVFPSVEKDEYGILYGPLVIDVYYGEIPERFLPVIPEDIEITTVSGLTLLQRIQNKIATFKWLNNLFGEPEKTTWESYDNSGLKSFLKDDSKETPSSMHCIEYGDLQIYNQDSGNENINLDKTIKQYSLTLDNTIKPLNGQVVLDVSKIEGNKIYFNISNLSGFTNTSNGIYIYFSVNNETDENNATLYKMKLPKTSSNKGLLLTIPDVSNIESLYIYRTPIMVDSTKTGITPKIYFSSEKGDLTISVHDRTTLNTVI